MARRGTPAERFMRHVELAEDGCWIWKSVRLRTGYGKFNIDGRMQLAHRVSYELHVGPIPEGREIDHLCSVRSCVNPAHLEPVDRAENIRRSNGVQAINARKTHCLNGHPFDAQNTYIDPRGRRACRKCGVQRSLAYRHRQQGKDRP